jgi:hypothetical protein
MKSVAGRYERTINIVASLVSLFLLLAALISWLSRQHILAQRILICGFGYTLGVASTTIVLNRRALRMLEAMPLGYRIDNVEVHYKMESPSHFRYSVRYILTTFRANVNHTEEAYNPIWSGRSSEVDVEVTSPGHYLMGPSRRSGTSYRFFIFLGRDLGRSESTRVAFAVQGPIPPSTDLQPVLQRGISKETKQLTLRVTLPKNISLAEAVCEERRSREGTMLRTARPSLDEEAGQASWTVESPVFGHVYAIRWQWPQDPARDRQDHGANSGKSTNEGSSS